MYNYTSLVNSFDEYFELRLQKDIVHEVMVSNGELIENSISSLSGSSARALINGTYGFASINDISEKGILNILNTAKKNAIYLSKISTPNEFKHIPFKSTQIVNNNVKTYIVDQESIIDFSMSLDSYIDKKYPSLLSHSIKIKITLTNKQLFISDRSDIVSITPLCFIYCTIVGSSKTGDSIELFKPLGGYGYFEDLFPSIENLFNEIDNLYIEFQNKCNGIYPNAGSAVCILDPSISGILAHEAVGHLFEADNVLNSAIKDLEHGTKVASDLVTMIDFGYSAFGESVPIPMFYDDEGTPTKDVVLIQNGRLNNYLNNQSSAYTLNITPSGNARASLYYDEPLIRMRNTAILPGNSTISEMISSIDSGYYLVQARNGQADITGEFMFGITIGYEIKNGKIGAALRNTTISGMSFDVLKTINMISNKLEWNYGNCIKQQVLPVAIGGAAIKCKLTIGGK
ncbi:MAG: TldD/PmbA family protein [Clostridium sp.]